MKKLTAFVSAFALAPFGPPGEAVEYNKATITRIVGGDQVFINQGKAETGDSAQRGSSLRTGEARARLLFDPSAIGLMNRNTQIQLGDQCFRGERGSVLVNGRLIACLGGSTGQTRLAGSRGTTFVLNTLDDGSTVLSVLAGEVVVGESESSLDLDPAPFSIEAMYPTIAPSISASVNLISLQDPRSSPDWTGGFDVYLPLSQSASEKLVYGYGSIGSDFNRYFNGGIEFGKRWFNPSDRSILGVFTGYDNYQSSECSNSFLTSGVEWERSRFRIGAAGGFKLDACEIGFSYGQLNVSFPVVELSSRRSARLNLSPYLLWGNDLLALNNPKGNDDLGEAVDLAVGGRIGLDVPVSDSFDLGAYSSYDDLYGFVVGGQIRYRLPLGSTFVKDPNLGQPEKKSTSPDSEILVIGVGRQAKFSNEGELLSPVSKISPADLRQLLLNHLSGQDRLPESRLLADLAEQEGILDTQMAGILGIDFDRNGTQPVSRSINAMYGTQYSPALKYQPRGQSWRTWRRQSMR